MISSTNISIAEHTDPDTYVEVQSFTGKEHFKKSTKNNANIALMPHNTCNEIISSTLCQQPTANKQYHHQYTKSSPVLLSPSTTKRTMSSATPQNGSEIDLDHDIPPPLLPPITSNHAPHPTNYHQHQLSLPSRYQQQLTAPAMSGQSDINQMPSQQFHCYQQQQQLSPQQQQHFQEPLHLNLNNADAVYGINSPTVSETILHIFFVAILKNNPTNKIICAVTVVSQKERKLLIKKNTIVVRLIC